MEPISCPAGTPIGSFQLVVTGTSTSAAPRSLQTLNQLLAGYHIRYHPESIKGPDKKKARISMVLVPSDKGAKGKIIVLDPKKNYLVVKDLKVSRRPRDMHFNADHTKLYVACGDDDVIDIIDVAKLEVIGKLSTGASPETFGIDEARRRIYVSNEEGSSLSVRT